MQKQMAAKAAALTKSCLRHQTLVGVMTLRSAGLGCATSSHYNRQREKNIGAASSAGLCRGEADQKNGQNAAAGNLEDESMQWAAKSHGQNCEKQSPIIYYF